MSLALQLKKLSRTEKLQAMESLWIDLSKDEGHYQSPAWHGAVLKEAQHLVKEGKAKFGDWDEAKERLRRKTAKTA